VCRCDANQRARLTSGLKTASGCCPGAVPISGRKTTSRKDSPCGMERKAQVEAKHGGAAGISGREHQALVLRLMTKLWRRFEAMAERELGAESDALAALRIHARPREGKSPQPYTDPDTSCQ